MSKKFQFQDKVAVVTGGSRGIGRKITLKLAREGASVAFLYKKNIEAANETISMAKDYFGSVEAFQTDVSDYKLVERTIKVINHKYKQIDILVNNAGILKLGRTGFLNPEEWPEVIDINLKGVINCCHAVARPMIARKKGKIINVSSLSSLYVFEGQSVYSATKAGVNMFTRCLAKELSRFGIIVNAVAPGLVNTEMGKVFSEKDKNTHFTDVEKIVEWIIHLALDKTEVLNGHVIPLGKIPGL